MAKAKRKSDNGSAPLGIESRFWAAADALRHRDRDRGYCPRLVHLPAGRTGQRGGPAALGDKGHINHHPAHVVRLKKRADEVGMDVVAIAPNAGLAPKPEVSMIEFFFKHLGVE